MNNDQEKNYLNDYLLREGNKKDLLIKIQKLVRKLPPILGGTIATYITSNPVFIGIGSILILLGELGIDTKELILLLNDEDVYKVPKRKKYSKKVINLNDRRNIVSLKSYFPYFYNDLFNTMELYDLILDISIEEIKLILKEIDLLIIKKGYEVERTNIFEEYYKRMLANAINNGENRIDYYNFMDALKYLKDMNLCDKKELDLLIISIIDKKNRLQISNKKQDMIFTKRKFERKKEHNLK